MHVCTDESTLHSSPIITVTKSNVSSTTLAPATTSTTLLSASTTSSPECPAANGSTYIANNKPYSDLSSKHMIPETTLTYQILCNTNFQTNTTTVAQVLQIINNVTSLKDCLDACALYSFQTPSDNFPSLGCSGVTWNHNDVVPDCWLKRSMTLLLNDVESGIDAGVLIMPNT